MDLDISGLEDGEITDEYLTYTPLERPSNYSELSAPQQKVIVEPESEEELQTSSESDSDSDSQIYKAKKPKVRLKKSVRPLPNKQKKYDIWNKRVHEDILSETLTSCDVSIKDRSRNVESYDYTLGEKYYGNSGNKNSDHERTNSKRNRDDRKNKNLKPMKREIEKKYVKGSVKYILDLKDDVDCNVEKLATDICNKLFEEKQDLFERIIRVMGVEKTKKIFENVQKIEADGGMLIMNQSRRRTPGGVFLFLVKHDDDLTKEQLDIIFEDERKALKEQTKQKKKERHAKLKMKIMASKKSSNLPELLTRAEVVQKLNEDNWSPKESSHDDVVNPPPTPETDGHADSGDNMEGADVNCRKHETYDNDFLDLHAENDMEMF